MTIAGTGCSLSVRREEDLSARTVIMVPLRNSRRTLRECLLSALDQTGLDRPCLALLDDRSDDGWKESVSDFLAGFPHVVFRAALGTAWRARNALLDGCDRLFREARCSGPPRRGGPLRVRPGRLRPDRPFHDGER